MRHERVVLTAPKRSRIEEKFSYKAPSKVHFVVWISNLLRKVTDIRIFTKQVAFLDMWSDFIRRTFTGKAYYL